MGSYDSYQHGERNLETGHPWPGASAGGVGRREALLDEFERSGSSAARFARLAGIKYPTFANWVHQRRKGRGSASVGPSAAASLGDGVARTGPARLFEALVEGSGRTPRPAMSAAGLMIELPGGSRLRIESPVHLEMAAELVALIAQRARARC